MLEEHPSPKPTPRPYATLLAIALLFAAVHSFADLLSSSGSPYLLGGDVVDWLQIVLGLVVQLLAFFCFGGVILSILLRTVRRPWSRSFGATLAGVLTVLAFAGSLRTLAPGLAFTREWVLLGAALGTGILLLALEATGVLSSQLFCVILGCATLAGIVSLHGASKAFFLHAERPAVAGGIAVLWAVSVGFFGVTVALLAKRQRARPLFSVMVVISAGSLLPLVFCLRSYAALPGRGAPPVQVVLVTCDALRADYCSVYGGDVPTPNMEALAEEGVVFDQFYSLAPWTLPSVCGMFASKYPPSMAPGAATRQWLNVLGPRAEVMEYWLDRDASSQLDRMRDREVLTAAFIANRLMLSERWLFRGFTHLVALDHVEPELRSTFQRFPALNRALGRFFPAMQRRRPLDTTRVLSQYAVEFIRRHRNRSYFLWIHFMDPHDPYDPPERFRTMAGDWQVFSPADDRYESVDAKTVRAGKLTQEQRRYVRSLYEGEIRYVDEAIGRIHRALRQSSEGNAFLWLTSDHGEELWDHGGWGHGNSVYQEQIHVPFILCGPRVVPGRITAPTSAVDVIPSLSQLMHTPSQPGWRGAGFIARARGRSRDAVPGPCFAQGTSCAEEPLRCVVDGRFKLIQGLASGRVELYDVEADPRETVNLFEDDPGQAASLQELLDQWAASFPSSIPDFGETELDEELEEQMVDRLRAIGYM